MPDKLSIDIQNEVQDFSIKKSSTSISSVGPSKAGTKLDDTLSKLMKRKNCVRISVSMIGLGINRNFAAGTRTISGQREETPQVGRDRPGTFSRQRTVSLPGVHQKAHSHAERHGHAHHSPSFNLTQPHPKTIHNHRHFSAVSLPRIQQKQPDGWNDGWTVHKGQSVQLLGPGRTAATEHHAEETTTAASEELRGERLLA